MNDKHLIARIAEACPDHELREVDDELHQGLVAVLARNGISVADTRRVDGISRNQAIIAALKTFQGCHHDQHGNPLDKSGRLDPPTVEALFFSKRRKTLHHTNFWLAVVSALLFLFWNNSFWTETQQRYRELFMNATFGGGVLYMALLQAPRDSPFHLGSAIYKLQGRLWVTFGLIGTLAAISFLLIVKPNQVSAVVQKEKKLVHVAVVGSDVPYSDLILQGFVQRLEALTADSPYLLHIETTKIKTIGIAVTDSEYKPVVDELLSRFSGSKVDCLVTIGSQASVFARQKYPEIPLFFLGVTDPQKLGLVTTYAADPSRGNIAGSVYPIDADTRMRFIADAFPRRKLGFIYNPTYPQDVIMRDRIVESVNKMSQPVEIAQIEVTGATLTAEQEKLADVFFGYAYLNAHFREMSSRSKKPFIGISLSDGFRYAVAAVAGDDRMLGKVSAEKFSEHIIGGRALSDIDILTMDAASMLTLINKKIALRQGVTIGATALSSAKIILEEN